MAAHARVLVADDDPQMLAAVGETIERMGHDVARATSGADLVDQLALHGPFDLIVTDVSMPWMDGLKALSSMRSAGLMTPVVVMTALTSEQIPAQVKALGSRARLLQKPFDLGELEDAVRSLTPAAPLTVEKPR